MIIVSRVFTLTILASLALPLLPGCGSTTSAEPAPITEDLRAAEDPNEGSARPQAP